MHRNQILSGNYEPGINIYVKNDYDIWCCLRNPIFV